MGKQSTKQIELYKLALCKILDIYEADHFGRQEDAFLMASWAAAVMGLKYIRREDMPVRQVNGHPSCYYDIPKHIKKIVENIKKED